jgi:hypothetical protein
MREELAQRYNVGELSKESEEVVKKITDEMEHAIVPSEARE